MWWTMLQFLMLLETTGSSFWFICFWIFLIIHYCIVLKLLRNGVKSAYNTRGDCQLLLENKESVSQKINNGGILDAYSLRTLEDRKDFLYPFSLFVHNTKPISHQDLVGLVISMMILADLSLVLLTLLQLYTFSLADVFIVVFILPLGILSPFPAGINDLFSHGPRRSVSLAHVYALWNMTSLVNVVMAFMCGFMHYKHSSHRHSGLQPWSLGFDESGWCVFPTGLLVCKCVQARLVDWVPGLTRPKMKPEYIEGSTLASTAARQSGHVDISFSKDDGKISGVLWAGYQSTAMGWQLHTIF